MTDIWPGGQGRRAARHGAVEEARAVLGDALGERDARVGRDRAQVGPDRARAQAGEDAVLAVRGGLEGAVSVSIVKSTSDEDASSRGVSAQPIPASISG